MGGDNGSGCSILDDDVIVDVIAGNGGSVATTDSVVLVVVAFSRDARRARISAARANACCTSCSSSSASSCFFFLFCSLDAVMRALAAGLMVRARFMADEVIYVDIECEVFHFHVDIEWLHACVRYLHAACNG